MNKLQLARIKQDFRCRHEFLLVRKGWLIKLLQFQERVDYDDYGNGDVIVMEHDTDITFELHNEIYYASFRGRLSDMVEILPDTPATYILFDKQGKV